MKIINYYIFVVCIGYCSFLTAMEEGFFPENTRAEDITFPQFTQLPKELRAHIITMLAKEDLKTAINSIRNAFLVNKEWEQFINSKQGMNAIVQQLLQNNNVQELFSQIAQVITQHNLEGGQQLTENQKKVILLSLLETKQAQSMLKTVYKDDLIAMTENFLPQLVRILFINKQDNLTETMPMLQPRLLLIILRDVLGSLRGVVGQGWQDNLSAEFVRNYASLLADDDKYKEYDASLGILATFPEIIEERGIQLGLWEWE